MPKDHQVPFYRMEKHTHPSIRHAFFSDKRIPPTQEEPASKGGQNGKIHLRFKDVARRQLTNGDMESAVQTLILLRDAANGAHETAEGHIAPSAGKIEDLLTAIKDMTGQRLLPKNMQILPASKIRECLQVINEIAGEMHEAMILDEKLGNSFDANWNLGRLLHNLGKPNDALPYIAKARRLQPDNPKVAARLTDVRLEIYKETPTQDNEIATLLALGATKELEVSPHVARLQIRVQEHLNI